MRVFIDTNVWVSALLWKDSLPHQVVQRVIREHTVVLSTGIMEELRDVFRRKFPQRLTELEQFFCHLSYEMAPEPLNKTDMLMHVIRDPNDVHVLAAALAANVDVLLTGDQDFADLTMTKPLILTPRQYQDNFP